MKSLQILICSFLILLFFVSGLAFQSVEYSSTTTSVRLVTTIPVGRNPDYVVYNPSNKFVYVTNEQGVAIINSTTNIVVKKVVLNQCCGISDMIYNPSNKEVYVSAGVSSSQPVIFVLKGTKLVQNISLAQIQQKMGISLSPKELLYNPSNKFVYVNSLGGGCEYGCGSVTVIDSATNMVIKTLVLPEHASPIDYGLVYDPADHEVYVSAGNITGWSGVVVISGAKIVGSISINSSVGYLLFNPFNNFIYVETGKGMSLIDGTTLMMNIPIATPSGFFSFSNTGIQYDPSNKEIYVSVCGCRLNTVDSVVEISSKTNDIVANITVSNTVNLAYDRANQGMYFTNYDGSVGVIGRSNTVVRTLELPNKGPLEIIYNPSNSDMYVTNNANNSVSVISS